MVYNLDLICAGDIKRPANKNIGFFRKDGPGLLGLLVVTFQGHFLTVQDPFILSDHDPTVSRSNEQMSWEKPGID